MSEKFDAGKLADELRALAADAEALLRNNLNVDGAALREQAQESVRDLRERLGDLEDQLGERARDVDAYVRDNPWQTVAVVGGIALLVGLLMGRRQ